MERVLRAFVLGGTWASSGAVRAEGSREVRMAIKMKAHARRLAVK